MIISPYKEMEIDGYFRMEKFEVNMFNENEVEIIFSNINKDEEKNFVDSIIEDKLGSNKVDELIKQIRKNHRLLKLKDKKDTVLIGFINSNKINNRDHFNTLGDKKCGRYGIKDSIFCGKEVTYQIDWDLERRVKSLEAILDALNSKINKIYDHITKAEKKESGHKKDDDKKEEVAKEKIIEIKEKEEENSEKVKKKDKKKGRIKECDEEKKEETGMIEKQLRQGKKYKEEINLLQKKMKRKNIKGEKED